VTPQSQCRVGGRRAEYASSLECPYLYVYVRTMNTLC
jgi:hypothetical protein